MEPLSYFYKKFDVDLSEIKKIISGKSFTAVVLQNGNIGTCANNKNTISENIEDYSNLELKKLEHRVFYNAYLNSKYTYTQELSGRSDIIELIESGNYKKPVMIGYFESIVKKMISKNIDISVFDFDRDEEEILPLEYRDKYITKSDALIITGTTIFNKTFLEMISLVPENCDVFIMGPSTLLNSEMFRYKGVKALLGAKFKPNDERILSMIKDGYEPKQFLKFGEKVALFNNQK